MIKEYLNFNCSVDCEYSSFCCQVPTEVIRHNDSQIDILIFGMGPGREEEREKRCFIGRSGKYMRSIIKYLWDHPTVGLFNLAISNNVRFRPVDEYDKDREPTKEEINRCIIHLKRDILALNPKVIVPVGKNASNTLLDLKNAPMSNIRGVSYELEIDGMRRIIVPTWHPSFLVRQYGKFDPSKNNFHDNQFISDITYAINY
jgi:DNA polymerase